MDECGHNWVGESFYFDRCTICKIIRSVFEIY